MKIKILGTLANIENTNPLHKNHSGILIDNKILVDVGEKEFLGLKPKLLLFTHLHPDHAYFVKKGETINTAIPAFGPETHGKMNSISIVAEGDTIEAEGYKITAVPVIHSIKAKSFGYIIKKKDKKIFISGDVAWIEQKYREQFPFFDLVVTEGSYIRKGGMVRRDKNTGNIFGHTGIPDLVKMLGPYTQHILFVHLGNWFVKDVSKGRERIKNLSTKNLNVEAAVDGQELKL